MSFITTSIANYIVALSKYGMSKSSAMLLSGIIVGILNLSDIFGTFTDGITIEHFSYLIVGEVGFFLFYAAFTFVNFVTGIQAARYEHKQKGGEGGFIDNDKLWNTLWKSLGILFLTLMVCFLAVLLLAMGYEGLYWAAIWFVIAFWLLANSYEFHSVGENIKRRFGKKPKLFSFWDKIIKILEENIFKKLTLATMKTETPVEEYEVEERPRPKPKTPSFDEEMDEDE
jgi:predicted MFS family arabinose efflux permease